MDEFVIKLVMAVGVWLRGKPYQPIAVQVDCKRVQAGDQNIQSKIKLVSIDQVWVGDVLLYNGKLLGTDITDVIRHSNSLSALVVRRLHNPEIS